MTVDANKLATYLGVDSVDADRAELMIDLAMQMVAGVLGVSVDAIPDEAERFILSSASRAYQAPTPQTAQMVGPYQVSGVGGGLTLTKAEKADLLRLGGKGGAFMIDAITPGAGTGLPPWDVGWGWPQ